MKGLPWWFVIHSIHSQIFYNVEQGEQADWTIKVSKLNIFLKVLCCVPLFWTHGLIYVGFRAACGMLNIGQHCCNSYACVIAKKKLFVLDIFMFFFFLLTWLETVTFKIIKKWVGDRGLGWRNRWKVFFLTYLEYWGMETKLLQAL